MVYQLDATFAALSDPTRREILARLSTGERTISELAGRFDMSLPAVSKHVRVLERAGLASIRRDGRTRRTTLTAAPMRDALAWIEKYRQFWEFQFDQLAAYLEGGKPTEETSTWQSRRKPRAKRWKSDAPSTPPERGSSKRGRKRKR